MMLESLEHRPPVETRHVDVERDRVGLDTRARSEPAVAVEADDSLEPLLARHVEQDLREVHIVLDDENSAIARLDVLVVILHHVLSCAPLRRAAPVAASTACVPRARCRTPRRIGRDPRRRAPVPRLDASGRGVIWILAGNAAAGTA